MGDAKILEIHTHSTASDGQYSPDRLGALMAERDVDLWALTDHDTVDGCRAARRSAEEGGVGFIAGIEVSAECDETSIHVLGYGFDVTDARLGAYGDEMEMARRERMAAMVDRMCGLGVDVSMDDVLRIADGGNLCRPHLAKALVARGHVDDIQGAFDRWLAIGRPGYVKMGRPAVTEAIEMLTDAGGLVVLAHPARYGDVSSHLGRWKEAGLWGLEARHPSHDTAEEGRLIRQAKEFGLGITASNDWHGHKPGEAERLGKVAFPEAWRRRFLEALGGRG